LNFPQHIFEKYSNIKFHEICLEEDELCQQTDGQT